MIALRILVTTMVYIVINMKAINDVSKSNGNHIAHTTVTAPIAPSEFASASDPITTPRPTYGPALLNEECWKENNIDYFGYDIINKRTGGINECARWCSEVQGCKFWTFNKYINRCFAKTSNFDRRTDKYAISGPRSCATDDASTTTPDPTTSPTSVTIPAPTTIPAPAATLATPDKTATGSNISGPRSDRIVDYDYLGELPYTFKTRNQKFGCTGGNDQYIRNEKECKMAAEFVGAPALYFTRGSWKLRPEGCLIGWGHVVRDQWSFIYFNLHSNGRLGHSSLLPICKVERVCKCSGMVNNNGKGKVCDPADDKPFCYVAKSNCHDEMAGVSDGLLYSHDACSYNAPTGTIQDTHKLDGQTTLHCKQDTVKIALIILSCTITLFLI